MMSANNGLDVGYNVQTAVDSKHSLIVDNPRFYICYQSQEVKVEGHKLQPSLYQSNNSSGRHEAAWERQAEYVFRSF
jgi:hypothetical protein